MDQSVIREGLSGNQIVRMKDSATDASDMLKAISHEGRLMILCHLVTGEKSVAELEDLLSIRQAAASQQLARLRHEGLVKTRRDGKQIYYSISSHRARRMLEVIYELYCADDPTKLT